MFDSLSERLGGILDRLTRRGALSEADVDAALREVRRALLEADVALDVVRAFTEKVKANAVGVEVIKSVTPGQFVVKIVHDQLIDTLGAESQTIDLNAPAPVPIMMVGLQGSGKTTTTAKLAKRLTEQGRRKVLMASLDVYRPAARSSSPCSGGRSASRRCRCVAGQQPTQIAQRALQAGRLGGYDVVLLDTAGRTTLDEAMMTEAADVKRAANPHEVLLVADSLTGQDAVNLARAFDERVGLTGIVLTRVDGDGRGGAALSMRAVTGKPIKLMGTGEQMDALEDFHPSRIADRILGMGDIVSLVEKAAAEHRHGEGRAHRRAHAQGPVRSQRPARAAHRHAADGRHERPDGHAARRRQDEEPARRRQPRRARAQAADGGDRFDDAEGAPEPRHPQGEPQEAHRVRRRREGRGHQPHAQDAPADGRRDEGDGLRQARPDGRHRQHARPRRRRRDADARADGGDGEEDAGRRRGRAGLPPTMPALPPKFPGGGPLLPGLGGPKPGLGGFPGLGKKK